MPTMTATENTKRAMVSALVDKVNHGFHLLTRWGNTV